MVEIKFTERFWISTLIVLVMFGTLAIATTTISDSHINIGSVGNISKSHTCIVSQDGTGDYNGSTQAEIQNCINLMNTAGGGSVYVRNGTYTISSDIIMKDNVNLIGDGMGTILFTADSRSVDNSAVINNSGVTTDIMVRDLYINGNKPQTNNIRGIHFRNVTGARIENVYIYNTEYLSIAMDNSSEVLIDHVTVDNSSDWSIDLWNTDNSMVSNCIVKSVSPSMDGIALENGAHHNTVMNNHVYDCIASAGAQYGIKLDYSPTDNVIMGNTVENCFNGLYLHSGATRNTIISNIFSNLSQTGWLVYGDYNNFVNNEIYDIPSPFNAVQVGSGSGGAEYNTFNGNIIHSTGYGLVSYSNYTYMLNNMINNTAGCIIMTHPMYSTVSNNIVANCGGGYGIQLGGNADYNQITGNQMQDTTNKLDLGSGTHNIVMANQPSTKDFLSLGTAQPSATEGYCYWNNTAGYKCLQCYNSTDWVCA